MSTSDPTSPNGGMTHNTRPEHRENGQIDASQHEADTSATPDAHPRVYTRELRVTLARLQGWATATDHNLDIPTELSEIPLPQYGGREWVAAHEDELPFEILVELVRLVELNRMAVDAYHTHSELAESSADLRRTAPQ